MRKLIALIGLLSLFGFGMNHGYSKSATNLTITTPILSVTPWIGNLGCNLVGVESGRSFTLKNTGDSLLMIRKIEIVGSCFSLVDNHAYPFEIMADTSSTIPMGNRDKSLEFSVVFAPDSVGVFRGKVIITYGMYGEQTHEIKLVGSGISCDDALVATKGENWAPHLDVRYQYTADHYSMVEVNMCHPQQITNDNPATCLYYFFVYDGCGGPQIPEFDEWLGSCPYDLSSPTPVGTVMFAGQTIIIDFPQYCTDTTFSNEGFWFNIEVTDVMDGDVCETAIPLTLPVVNMFGSTDDFNDDYDYSPCSPVYNYLDGNDIVYTITIPQDGYLNGSILGAYASVHVLDICPKEEFSKEHCIAYTGGSDGGQFTKRIQAGTYYVIVSSWSPPQSVDFLLNLSWQGSAGVDPESSIGELQVFPNPAQKTLTVSITNDGVSDVNVELISITGQRVYHKEAKATFLFNDQIDVSTLARGMYYLKANNGKRSRIEKVIIQ